MNKLKRNNFFLATVVMFTIISVAIVATVFFKQLYYFDIKYLKIDEMVNLPIETLKENYDILIKYQSIFYNGDLYLPDFKMSASGLSHFVEVKNIFEVIQIIMTLGVALTTVILYKKIKEKDFIFFKITSILTILTPTIIGMLVSINFSKAFEIFHKIVFRNNDWIFNPFTDPIILALPEEFFMHCFIMIVSLVLLMSFICYLIYKKIYLNILKEIPDMK